MSQAFLFGYTMQLEVAPKSTEIKLNWEEAMLYCRLLDIEGKSDWILPTQEELAYLYRNREKYDFECDWYWSSTELNANGAWLQYFGSGIQANDYKNGSSYVRAVRSL